MEFRDYQLEDRDSIVELFTSVFTIAESESEGALLGNLSKEMSEGVDGNDILGFVALEDKKIVGTIFFSRMTFEVENEVFILSPVAVESEFQGKGVGQKLIRYGLEAMRVKGVELVVTYGDPKFYSKVGFKQISEEIVKAPFKLSQPIGWLGQSLVGGEIQAIPGESSCVGPLSNKVYW